MTRALDVATVTPFLDPSHHRLAAAIQEFAESEIEPLGHPESDREGRETAVRILRILGEHGWCRYAVPAAYGGATESVDSIACCLIRDALAATSPLADSVFALQCLGSMPLVLHGTEEARREWLPRVAEGKAMAGFAMTEAGAGSDVKSIATRYRAKADGYELTGTKRFITNAGLADFYTVFARGGEGEGLACLLVPSDTPGFRFVAAQVLSAPHPLGEIAFEQCGLPADALVGSPGEGFEVGMQTLDRLRATVAAAACGMASRALCEARSHAETREQFGRPLGRFQLVQQKLAVMATELAASRLLTYRAARAVAEGHADVTLRSAMAKYQATESAQRVVDAAVQILGGSGVLREHPVDHLYRSVRALRIYEGASEIQQLVIARELARR